MQMLPPFEVLIDSNEMAVRKGLVTFARELAPLHLGDEEYSTVEIVLAEVLNNIVEHAYPPGEDQGVIKICCVQRAEGLNVEIVDRGRPMPSGKVPLGELSSLDVDRNNLPEGGFGWFLIHNLTKNISYERVEGCNRLRLNFTVGVKPSAT